MDTNTQNGRTAQSISSGQWTQLLNEVQSGSRTARNSLLEIAFGELRQMAGTLMRRERRDHTLQPTALVSEAALRILGVDNLQQIPGRAYFFGAMVTAMRRILVDHARASSAQRRGGDRCRQPLTVVMQSPHGHCQIDLVELDDSLKHLETVCPRQAEIVTLRFFGGMSMPEVAEYLDVSLSTVEKDWRFARAWLRKQLSDE